MGTAGLFSDAAGAAGSDGIEGGEDGVERGTTVNCGMEFPVAPLSGPESSFTEGFGGDVGTTGVIGAAADLIGAAVGTSVSISSPDDNSQPGGKDTAGSVSDRAECCVC